MPHCKIDNVDLHYTVTGEGPPLFLSFCLGGNLSMWGAEIDRLAKDFTVILWDPRGHGGTTSPEDPKAYGVVRAAADLGELMDHLGYGNAVVGGVSMGGGIAACFAGRYPSKTRAVLIIDSNTAAGLPVADKVVETRNNTIKLCEAGDMGKVADYFLETSPSYRLFAAKSPENEARLHAMIAAMNPTGFANTLRSMLASETTTEDLKSIKAPALVLAGEHDPASAAVELTAATITHCESRRIENAGHLSNIDQPVLFADEILEFTGRLL